MAISDILPIVRSWQPSHMTISRYHFYISSSSIALFIKSYTSYGYYSCQWWRWPGKEKATPRLTLQKPSQESNYKHSPSTQKPHLGKCISTHFLHISRSSMVKTVTQKVQPTPTSYVNYQRTTLVTAWWGCLEGSKKQWHSQTDTRKYESQNEKFIIRNDRKEEMKNLVDCIRNSVDDLNSKLTTAEIKTEELQDEIKECFFK